MRRQTRGSRGSVLDLSIRGDELENRRIQLEHELQHTAAELSFKLSSVSDDDDQYHNHSVEYPRHNSNPHTFPDFASFEYASRDHFGDDSQIHPYSYRTDEDEGGINPYAGGETMSTAAHHASALTLSAGLGGRGVRRDVSLSGAEYDPDRPLQDMIAGVDSKLSLFDIEPSRSRYPGVSSVTFDPLVVDSTAELDRVLQSGYALPPNHMRVQSPLHSSSSSTSSSEHGNNRTVTHPKLADSLRKNVTFSPKRPRSAQQNLHEIRPHQLVSSSPLASARKQAHYAGAADQSAYQSVGAPTPKPKKRNGIFPSYTTSPGLGSLANTSAQPHVRLQPPTPTNASSEFSKMAGGLRKEIQQEQEHHTHARAEGSRAASTSTRRRETGRNTNISIHDVTTERNPFDVANTSVKQPTPRKASAMKSREQTPRGKVYLPDVTGITNAVESPAKMGVDNDYYAYKADDSPREIEARLITTLNTVQSKLQQLEEENSISRRRVRELEMELEVCKRDVARERTRVLEREEVIVQQQREVKKNAKGKARARDLSMNLSIDHELVKERYKEAVEEKKALEALITTLRTHLTRLTSELSSHKELLMSLRELRESDVRALKQKGEEIEKLREEVERLAGEVEVLRGVVEEGLKERRNGRDEASIREADADLGMSQDMEEDEEEHGEEEAGNMSHHEGLSQRHGREEEGVEDNEEPEPFDPAGIHDLSRSSVHDHGFSLADKTMRTDYATLGSSKQGQSTMSSGFVDSALQARDSEDRRSQHSSYRSAHTRTPSPAPSRRAAVRDGSSDDDDETEHGSRAASPSPSSRNSPYPTSTLRRPQNNGLLQHPATSKPRAPTPAKPQQPARYAEEQRGDETPFPQIRGKHLERLFFSAPEHNERTCNVCHRRGTGGHQAGGPVEEPSWIPLRFREKEKDKLTDKDEDEESEDEDEGFAEGSEQHNNDQDRLDQRRNKPHRDRVMFASTGSAADRWKEQARREGLPPQTVVARVIRELEDDFTHYKGIYVELADQYKVMDAVSDVPKRNILAKHLKEVVDILEQKGDQIASLYDTLTFKDKPVSASAAAPPPVTSSSKMRSASTAVVPPSSMRRKPSTGTRRLPAGFAN